MVPRHPALLPLRRVLYRADRVKAPECAVPVEPIVPTDGWCDDVQQADYNRMIRLPHDGHYEELWRQDEIYDVVGVLGWNDAPVRAWPGFGDIPACGAVGLRTDRRVHRARAG